MKNIYTVLLTGILFFSTALAMGQKDPLSLLRFGRDSEIIVKALEKENLISDPDFHNRYHYFLPTETEKIPVRISFNPDGREGKLRQVELDLINYSSGEALKESTLKKILSKYTEWYGNPVYTNHDTDYSYWREWVWELKNYDIKLRAMNGKSSYSPKQLDFTFSSIKYSMKNYEKDLENNQRSFVATLAPSEILHVGINNLRWENNSENSNLAALKIDMFEFFEHHKVNGRMLQGFGFKIIFENMFKEELGKTEELVFEIRSSLTQLPWTYTLTYDPNSKEGLELESIRKFANSKSVKVKAEVTRIAYQNGEILN